MKAKITYNLPEENLEYNRSFYASSLTFALWDLEQYLRKVEKYETGDQIENIRETFYDILNAYDINLQSLIE